MKTGFEPSLFCVGTSSTFKTVEKTKNRSGATKPQNRNAQDPIYLTVDEILEGAVKMPTDILTTTRKFMCLEDQDRVITDEENTIFPTDDKD